MQEEEKKIEPMVDIDTSGPGADVELPEEKPEAEVETKEDSSPAPQESAEEKVEASDEQQETKQEEKPEEKKDELETYSKDVQRRIAKLTKKWREAQRQADEALKFAENQKQQKEKLQQKYSRVEQAGVKDREQRITSGLQAAAAKLAAAKEAGDLAAEVEANKEIARLGYEEARLNEAKAAYEDMAKAEPKEQEIPKVSPQQAPAPDPRAEAWGAKNKWFGTDTAMTYTAFDLHKKLVDQEGFDPQSEEYYSEIDKRMRLEFPHKFDNNEDKVQNNTTKPTQIVASAKRSVNKTGRKTVRLTPSQVAIAKKLGVPLEEYAKQMKITKEV
jgi:DNA repair exonuclease SbcCD ATPase subunit